MITITFVSGLSASFDGKSWTSPMPALAVVCANLADRIREEELSPSMGHQHTALVRMVAERLPMTVKSIVNSDTVGQKPTGVKY